ncbi:hypothetical protein BDP27DRAFT_1300128 [Rhodocollybia butyracea]|uniref:DUF7918 domain-containing protein n=1 Tax=Rhodocollybia butyracea TaxID=206335 RepID=A0A9P5U1G3_9AGAR|nr:hypothetical protein BDP27DRAFT_1300128 [Rhodocollybia butyracea]
MIFFGNFGAWISFNGEGYLEEYGTETDYTQNKVTCYVPSEEGKAFQVHWWDKSFETATRGRVSVDGRPVGGKVISSKERCSVVKKGFRLSSDQSAPFVFAKLKVTDEEISSSWTEKPGEINLVIMRVRMRSRKVFDKHKNLPETPTFNEKMHKSAAHNTTYGTPVVRNTRIFEHDTEPYGDPVAHFCFRYMPIDLLRAKDIAPYPIRKKHLPVKEEETKPDISGPADLAIDSFRSSSLGSTLVGSPSSSVFGSSRASSISTPRVTPIPERRGAASGMVSQWPTSQVSANVSRVIDLTEVSTSSSVHIKKERIKTERLVPRNVSSSKLNEVIDLTHL